MASIRNWSVSVPSKHDLYEETADTTVKPEGYLKIVVFYFIVLAGF